jgi:hypothetical protein
MQVGDIVKISNEYVMPSHQNLYGVISQTHFDGRRAVVIFPTNTGNYYISMLELVSESR